MIDLRGELSPAERMVMAIDTSDVSRAVGLTTVARNAGAIIVKEGLELLMATSPKTCSEIAEADGLEWIADFKLKDIPTTVARAVEQIVGLDHPPIGITVHTKSGVKALSEARNIAAERGVMIFGVTHLTSIGDEETKMFEKAMPRTVVWRESRRAALSGIAGLVCSAEEVGMIKKFKKTKGLHTLIPGTRSPWAPSNDQKRIKTPQEAIEDGADMLVIGRQVTAAGSILEAVEAFEKTKEEIEQGLVNRNERTRRAE